MQPLKAGGESRKEGQQLFLRHLAERSVLGIQDLVREILFCFLHFHDALLDRALGDQLEDGDDPGLADAVGS